MTLRAASYYDPSTTSVRLRPSWSRPRVDPVLDPAFGYLIIAGAALLFASAAVRKFQDLGRFTEIFAAYRVLPAALAPRAAWIIPCIEIAIAAALSWAPGRRLGVASAIVVL